jgi:hypothetical protein
MRKKTTYLIKKDSGVILKYFSGTIDNATLFEQEAAQFLNPDFPNAPKVLADITTADFIELEQPHYEKFAAIYAIHRDKAEGAKVAIIAMDQFHKGRQYELAVRSMGVNVIVFTSVQTACVWLGICPIEASEWLAKKRTEQSLQ